jgi:hypothetical protein
VEQASCLLIFETKQAFLPVPQSLHSFCGRQLGQQPGLMLLNIKFAASVHRELVRDFLTKNNLRIANCLMTVAYYE